MSIAFVSGNLLDAKLDALVNPVNCVGIMGAGLALQFKWRFPENFNEYKRLCSEHKMQPGRVTAFRTSFDCPRFIINFPTKLHYKNPSKLKYIKSGLADLAICISKIGVQSIAVPPLGCGLGGLRWFDVRPIIVDSLGSIPGLACFVYEPRNVLQEHLGESIIQ
jgi:O-acetyl-ADP-ribose deacetylase (regulator of RNase III)